MPKTLWVVLGFIWAKFYLTLLAMKGITMHWVTYSDSETGVLLRCSQIMPAWISSSSSVLEYWIFLASEQSLTTQEVGRCLNDQAILLSMLNMWMGVLLGFPFTWCVARSWGQIVHLPMASDRVLGMPAPPGQSSTAITDLSWVWCCNPPAWVSYPWWTSTWGRSSLPCP
jgi:hypothetical protein